MDLKNSYRNLNKKHENLKRIIDSNNFDSLDIILKPIRINDIYDRNGITSNKKLAQDIIVTSKSIDKIVEL